MLKVLSIFTLRYGYFYWSNGSEYFLLHCCLMTQGTTWGIMVYIYSDLTCSQTEGQQNPEDQTHSQLWGHPDPSSVNFDMIPVFQSGFTDPDLNPVQFWFCVSLGSKSGLSELCVTAEGAAGPTRVGDTPRWHPPSSWTQKQTDRLRDRRVDRETDRCWVTAFLKVNTDGRFKQVVYLSSCLSLFLSVHCVSVLLSVWRSGSSPAAEVNFI